MTTTNKYKTTYILETTTTIHNQRPAGNTYASCGRDDPARKRRLNRISFADFQFPLAGTRSMRVEKKNVVMEKATASTSSATIVAERERQNKEQRELSAVDFLQEHS